MRIERGPATILATAVLVTGAAPALAMADTPVHGAERMATQTAHPHPVRVPLNRAVGVWEGGEARPRVVDVKKLGFCVRAAIGVDGRNVFNPARRVAFRELSTEDENVTIFRFPPTLPESCEGRITGVTDSVTMFQRRRGVLQGMLFAPAILSGSLQTDVEAPLKPGQEWQGGSIVIANTHSVQSSNGTRFSVCGTRTLAPSGDGIARTIEVKPCSISTLKRVADDVPTSVALPPRANGRG